MDSLNLNVLLSSSSVVDRLERTLISPLSRYACCPRFSNPHCDIPLFAHDDCHDRPYVIDPIRNAAM